MRQRWTASELAADWSLSDPELSLLANKSGATRLGFAIHLKFFQVEGRFPTGRHEVPSTAVEYVARQVRVDPAEWLFYDWDGRAIKYHRGEVRMFLGFREATVEDCTDLGDWLAREVLPAERRLDHLLDAAFHRLKTQRIGV